MMLTVPVPNPCCLSRKVGYRSWVPWLKKLNAAINTIAKISTGHCPRTAGQNAGLRFWPGMPRVAFHTGDSSTAKKMKTASSTGTTPIANIPRQPTSGISSPKMIDAIRYPSG